ncbi:SpoIIE family protein phosphatase, partial [Planctomycetota bacterium]
MFWLHAEDNKIDTLGADGIPMGIIPEIPPMPMQTITLGQGDIFTLLTDGFYEWARAD